MAAYLVQPNRWHILFGTSGTFNVTLSVSNSAGSNTITKQVVVGTYAQSLVGTYSVTAVGSRFGTKYTLPSFTCHLSQGSSADILNFDNFGGWGTSTVSSSTIYTSPFTINTTSVNVNSVPHDISAGNCVVNGNTITITYQDNVTGNATTYYTNLFGIYTSSSVQITETYTKQ